MLLPNFPEQLVYSVMPEIRSTSVYITIINSYNTVPLLSKQKSPQQLTLVVQCKSCENTHVKS